jgi:hypothetical protein
MLFRYRYFINVVFLTNNYKMYLQNIFKISHRDVFADCGILFCSAGGCTGSGEICRLHPGPDLED